MAISFVWGFIAASSLLVGGVLGTSLPHPLSNFPEAIAAISGLAQSGWARSRILGLWTPSRSHPVSQPWPGFALFDSTSIATGAFVLSFAAGAMLTMLADTMMPEAFEHGGKLVGLVTTFGFAVAFAISALE